jgi:hypothetical protein
MILFADKSQRQWQSGVNRDEFTYVLKDEVVQRLQELGQVSLVPL